MKFLSRFFSGDSNAEAEAEAEPLLVVAPAVTSSNPRLCDRDCASTACVDAVRCRARLVLGFVGLKGFVGVEGFAAVIDDDADVAVDAGRLGMTTSIRGLRMGGSWYVRIGVPIAGTGPSSCVCVNSTGSMGGYGAEASR